MKFPWRIFNDKSRCKSNVQIYAYQSPASISSEVESPLKMQRPDGYAFRNKTIWYRLLLSGKCFIWEKLRLTWTAPIPKPWTRRSIHSSISVGISVVKKKEKKTSNRISPPRCVVRLGCLHSRMHQTGPNSRNILQRVLDVAFRGQKGKEWLGRRKTKKTRRRALAECCAATYFTSRHPDYGALKTYEKRKSREPVSHLKLMPA